MPTLRIASLLAAWRRAVAKTALTRLGTVGRQDAERDERRAEWAYEDESLRQHDSHGLEDPIGRRCVRASKRCTALHKDRADRKARSQRAADEAEIERELDE